MKRVPLVSKRKLGVFFADSLGFIVNFLEISQCRHVYTSCIEFMSENDPVAKNRIEFQWRSKLPGTSSEALENIVLYTLKDK